jgi:hypothetical protein
MKRSFTEGCIPDCDARGGIRTHNALASSVV